MCDLSVTLCVCVCVLTCVWGSLGVCVARTERAPGVCSCPSDGGTSKHVGAAVSGNSQRGELALQRLR